MVKVMEIDSQGRINLSRKAVLGGGSDDDAGFEPRPPRGNGAFNPAGNGAPAGGDRGGRRRRE
jgi:hypothetical protein